MTQLGAKEFVPLGLGDDQAGYGYNSALYPWLASFWNACELAGLGGSNNIISAAGIHLDTHYMVRLTTSSPPLNVSGNIPEDASVALEEVLNIVHSVNNITISTVSSNIRGTRTDWKQDVRLLELLLPDETSRNIPPFLGGDVSKVYTGNTDGFIVRMLARFPSTFASLAGCSVDLNSSKSTYIEVEVTPDCPVRKTGELAGFE